MNGFFFNGNECERVPMCKNNMFNQPHSFITGDMNNDWGIGIYEFTNLPGQFIYNTPYCIECYDEVNRTGSA